MVDFVETLSSIESEDELSDLENIIKGKQNVILGKGSNVAFSDKEFYGNVLAPKFEELTLSDNFEIKVGSSVFLPKLSRFFKDNSLSNRRVFDWHSRNSWRSNKNECWCLWLGIF